MKTDTFYLSHQNPLRIRAHQAMLNAETSNGSYAEMFYNSDLNGYKHSFVEFCKKNHWEIVKNYIEEDITINTSSCAFNPEYEIGYDIPTDYGDATMRYSTSYK